MILPMTLAFLYAAMYARITRATMLEILGEDYIRTARAKGLKEQVVIGRRHALHDDPHPHHAGHGPRRPHRRRHPDGVHVQPARAPAVRCSTPSRTRTCPIILGVTLITSLAVLIANLVVDVLYAVIDPLSEAVMTELSKSGAVA